MIAGFGIIGFRDPHGIRPLILGRRQTEAGFDYMLASESVVLEALGFTDFEDVKAGEAVIITREQVSRRRLVVEENLGPCIFEYVYFARQDSIIDGISVYKARLAMGEALADQVVKVLGDNMDIDVVIPVSVKCPVIVSPRSPISFCFLILRSLIPVVLLPFNVLVN